MAGMTYAEAAHLIRRMGFGGSPDEITDLAARGREGAVDYLINYTAIDNGVMEQAIAQGFNFSNPADTSKFNPLEIRRWWFTRMVYTRRQFEEKMTLFWHNHFATANSKVPEVLMYVQNQTLRRHALDRFDTLLLKVAQDPAMLVWLDGITNVIGSPNENFARELQELFTMGITDAVTGEANYTEGDVKEIARAFTGWKFALPGRNNPDPFNYPFFVNPAEHDNTAKTVYGRTANLGGDDVVAMTAARRETARYLVVKMFEFFVYPLGSGAADKATVDKFADVYMSRDHSIKELARAIFTSDEFFGDRAQFALVKQPIELIVGSIRMLGARYNPGTSERAQNSYLLVIISALLGQDLFNPPDVSGWSLNLGWVNTAAMLLRYNYADLLTVSRTANPSEPGVWVTHDQLRKLSKPNSKKTVKKLLSVLGPLNVSPETTRALTDYLETDDQGNAVAFTRDDVNLDKKVRGLIHQILCLPAFQMN